jgi:shikimate kinase
VNNLDQLVQYRQLIDDCDKKLVEIFEKRMVMVLKIIEYKKEKGLPVFHSIREQQVLDRVIACLKDKCFSAEIQDLYQSIMQISRKIQSKRLFPYNIVLIGFMGSGKSTIGKVLSQQLEMDWIDTDIFIENKMGMSIDQIFEKYGEEDFRNIECSVIEEISETKNKIISCGGGSVLNKENISNLKKNGKIIWLQAEVEDIYKRLKEDQSRPILKGKMKKEYISELLQERESYYLEASDMSIHTHMKDKDEIGKEIIYRLLKLF